MLVIRAEQMEAFRQAALRSFESEMVAHVFEFAPRQCQVVGEAMVRETVRLGFERASAYGLTNRGPLRSYVEMMFLFGSAFDTDPMLPWAGETLKSKDFVDQMERAETLFEQATNYLESVAGPENVHVIEALRNIAAFAHEPLSFSSEDIAGGLMASMRAIYPRKCDRAGEAALEDLIEQGIEGATKTLDLSTPRCITLLVMLKFILGHGVERDPLYPWISRTITDDRIVDPAARARRLEAKVLAYLHRGVKYLATGV